MKKKCARCGYEDPQYFGKDHGICYCRRCISFGRMPVGEPVRKRKIRKPHYIKEACLKFELTPYQKQISAKALQALKNHQDVFIYAAAGAGKTEITLESISWFLKQGKRVCFAISRRQVVLEIASRLQEYYPDLKVTPVCEGYPENYADRFDSDLIVCTMHQLYQYAGCFDLLIMDEVDAFPYAGSEMLETIAEAACRDVTMMLSATPDKKSMEKIEAGQMILCELFRRPHGHQLCVPEIRKCSSALQVIRILKCCRDFLSVKKQVLVFVPRREDVVWMKKVLSLAGKTEGIHSATADKDRIMQKFREKETDILVTTTLLERGITVGSVQVLIYQADHIVFTCASLVQIFGRVGRTFSDPEGTGICFCQKPSQAIRECINIIETMNRSLSDSQKGRTE